jgi:hypothetical protein
MGVGVSPVAGVLDRDTDRQAPVAQLHNENEAAN